MSRLTKAAMAALLLTLASIGSARAQYYDDDYGYSDPDIRQTVARLAYVSGDVAFARGDDPDDWQPADPNVPMTLGDRVWTAGGRLELQIHGGNIVRLAQSTDLAALNLTEDTKQFSLSAGVASFQIRRLYDDEVFEVDTPNAAITFERTGDYRVNVRPDGDTEVLVRRGRAWVASGGGQVPLGSGDAIRVEGYEPPRYDMVGMPPADGWDRWVADRDARYANVRSYDYVSPDIAGVEDLDTYGNWQQIPSYGWSWTPARVAVGWAPYRVGRWIWQDPWGWTWVSTEPWGWAPYHYGRWVTWSSRWYWVPVAPRVQVVAYSPALVAFVGAGPGFSVSVGVGTDYVGWFPLAPRDPLIPWWGRPPTTVVNVTNITYVNKTYVTVVNQNTFVSSHVVNTNYVRDQNVIRRIERAPVVRGAVPVVPTQASIRVATRQAAVARPPAAVAQRAVVTRLAPPPAPPRFDRKVEVIRAQKRPVTTVEAEQIVQRAGRAAPTRQYRPAAQSTTGQVALQPKTERAAQPRPEPVAPAARGRQLATKENPTALLSERTTQRARPAQPRDSSADAQREAQEKAQDQREQATRDARERAQREQAESQQQEQREQVQREQAQREQAEKQQQQREQVQRERAQQEQLDRQQTQREQAQQEQLERQQAQRQQQQREQAERQQAQREQAERQQAQREQAERQKAKQEQLERQQAQRQQAQREQAERQKAQQDQLERQEAQRQQEQRQQVQRQQAPRPTARPAPDDDQQPDRDQARQPNPNRQQPEAQSDRQDKDKEKSTTPQRGRGRPTPKPTPDKN